MIATMPLYRLAIDLQAIKAFFAGQPEVIVAYLFGSVARGQANPLSDIDIAILLDPGLESEISIERQLHFMAALEDFTDREVQVTILNRVSPTFAYQAIREGILLYERDRQERVDFQVRLMKTCFDIQPMLEFHNQTLLNRIREVGLDRAKRHSPRTLEAAERIRERLARASEC